MECPTDKNDRLPRVIYFRDYQSERLIRERHITANIHGGGSAKAARIATALANAGCDVTVVASGIPANRSFRFYRPFQDVVKGTNIPVYYAPVWDLPLLSHLVVLLYFFYFVARHRRPAIGFACNLSALSIGAAYALKLKGARVGFEYDDDCYMSLKGSRLRTRLKGAFAMFFAKPIASAFVCINRSLAEQSAPVPTYVLEGIAEFDAVAEPALAQPEDHKMWRLAYVGGINPLKGVMSLPAMLQALGPSFSLDIVGGGPLLQELRDACTALKLENVRVHGFVTNEEMAAISRQADIFLNPHFTHLGHVDAVFPFKIIEYLSFGRPVVSTSLAQCSSVLLEGIIIAENDSADAIADAVKYCVAHYAEYAANMQRVRQYVWAHHSVQQVGVALRQFLATGRSPLETNA